MDSMLRLTDLIKQELANFEQELENQNDIARRATISATRIEGAVWSLKDLLVKLESQPQEAPDGRNSNDV